jgi:hypothetical protein
VGHYHIGLMEQLNIHIDNLEQCNVIGKVSYLYVNGIRLGARCLEMINNVKISKATKLHFNFGQSPLRSTLSDRIVGLLTKYQVKLVAINF